MTTTLKEAILNPRGALESWRLRFDDLQSGHYRAASHYDRLYNVIGISAIITSSIVATSLVGTLEREGMLTIQIIIACMSAGAATLSGIQTFSKYGDRSEEHRIAGARYSDIKRRVEKMLAFQDEYTQEELNEVLETWNDINHTSPTIPKKIWQQVKGG